MNHSQTALAIAFSLTSGAGWLSPAITVQTPRGGDFFAGGQSVTVTFSVSDQTGVGNFQVDLSRDGGDSYIPLAIGVQASLRSAVVNLPNEDMPSAFIRVTALGLIGPIGEGRSGRFTVKKL